MEAGSSSTGTIASNVTMTKSTDTVAGVRLGYQFTENFGAEVFYTGVGKFTGNITGGGTVSGKTDAYGIAAVGTIPLSDAFAIFGRLGLASAKTTGKTSGGLSISATRNTATLGIGGQYNFNKNIGVRLAWDRYGASVNTGTGTNNFNDSVVSLGAIYNF